LKKVKVSNWYFFFLEGAALLYGDKGRKCSRAQTHWQGARLFFVCANMKTFQNILALHLLRGL